MRQKARNTVGVAACALGLASVTWMAAVAAPQAPEPQKPTFRSQVELLTIDASVRDKNGTAVPDLRPADFEVRVDGKPRNVVFAHFFGTNTVSEVTNAGAAPVGRYSGTDASTPGRALVLFIDLESIRRGQERAMFDTASKMIAQLSPADAVGIAGLGTTTIDLTRDHTAVVDALKKMQGLKPTRLHEHAITFEEAYAMVEKNDPTVRAAVMQRECEIADQFCPTDVMNDAANVDHTELPHADYLLRALTATLTKLDAVRAPLRMVVITGGVAFVPPNLSEYNELAEAAAQARIALYSVRLDSMDIDASSNGSGMATMMGDPSLNSGPSAMASMTGGLFFSGMGKLSGAFDRIASEVSTFYALGIESTPGDADGKAHAISVKIHRDGATARTPPKFIESPVKDADAIATALKQPIDVVDVPIAVGTYTVQGKDGRAGLLVSGELGARGGAVPTEWGFSLMSPTERVISTHAPVPAGKSAPALVSMSVAVPPGSYRLRVAAIDADHRVGVVEIPITVGFRSAGGAELSDLILGVASGGELEPRPSIAQAEDLMAFIQLIGADAQGVTGSLEFIPGGRPRPTLTIPLTPQAPGGGQPGLSLLARSSLSSLAPGRYTASAVLERNGQPFARVSRIIEVEASTASALAAAAAAGSATPAATAPAPDAAKPAAENPHQTDRDAESLMRRVADYVSHYGEASSAIVSVEHYSQSVDSASEVESPSAIVGQTIGRAVQRPTQTRISGVMLHQKRVTEAEFAVVPSPATIGGWAGFRDVLKVDGKPIPDRKDRLQTLFNSAAPDLEAAKRINEESTRLNIGPTRSFNIPTVTLFFFTANNLSRFTFQRSGTEKIDGVETQVIAFKETASPTLVMNSSGKDAPASGTLWVNPVDGSVLRTRLRVQNFKGLESAANMDVDYARDDKIGMWLPSRMREDYAIGSTRSTNIATYTDYKQFTTTARIK